MTEHPEEGIQSEVVVVLDMINTKILIITVSNSLRVERKIQTQLNNQLGFSESNVLSCLFQFPR